MTEWFEDEDFWKTLDPFMFPPATVEGAADEVAKALALIRFDGRDVLDLCCGPGRHSVELAKRGLAVTGVDRSRFLLRRARERSATQSVEVDWVEDDMRSFRRLRSFDLVLSMFTSFGYFDDPEDDLEVLRNVLAGLRPGGTLLIDVVGKEWIANAFQPTSSEVLADGRLLVQRREIFDDWSRIRNEWIVVDGERAKRFRFHHTLYSARELKDRLAAVGFERVEAFGGLDGSPYGVGSTRLVIVARKPGARLRRGVR